MVRSHVELLQSYGILYYFAQWGQSILLCPACQAKLLNKLPFKAKLFVVEVQHTKLQRQYKLATSSFIVFVLTQEPYKMIVIRKADSGCYVYLKEH